MQITNEFGLVLNRVEQNITIPIAYIAKKERSKQIGQVYNGILCHIIECGCVSGISIRLSIEIIYILSS